LKVGLIGRIDTVSLNITDIINKWMMYIIDVIMMLIINKVKRKCGGS